MQLTAVLIPAQEGGCVAINPETGTSTQGESIEEALVNLQEATGLYLEELPLVSYGQPLMTTFERIQDVVATPCCGVNVVTQGPPNQLPTLEAKYHYCGCNGGAAQINR